MDFRIAHRFPCTPQAYWDMTRNPAYEREVQGADTASELLELKDEGAQTFERRRIAPAKPLPAVMAKAVGRDRLSWVQEVTSDNTAFTTRWKVVSDVLTDKVRCAGTSRVVAAPGGCERVIEGTIDVSVFMVGGTIEKHIAAELQQGYDRAAAALTRLLASG